MAETILAEVIKDILIGVPASWAISKILDHYLSVPLILKAPWLKYKGKMHEYEGRELIAEYWKDLLGPDYGMEEVEEKKLREYHVVTFRDVIVTDFVPRFPGYYYSKELWNDPKNALVSLGVIRVIENENRGPKRLLAINSPSEFEAHENIEKGIPIVVSREVHKELSEGLSKFGSVHVDQITATLSNVGTYSKYLETVGMPATYPVIEKKKYIKHVGEALPMMGNAWVVYRSRERDGFLHYRFWTGVEYHSDSLKKAKEKLEKLIPKDGLALTDFDEKIPHFRNAPLQLSEVWKYYTKLK